jgi:RNA polymerase sigma factor (sigma-70 family)
MLFGLAYRLLGSVHDAEDVLQEAFLRWVRSDASAVVEPRRYLTRVVARLAVDFLRSVRARRETYVGEWLPEPIATEPSPFDAVDTSDLSIAMLHLMERLTPPQRAAFVLRSAFDLPYDEIAGILGRTVEDCRQLHHRAESALRSGRPRFAPTSEQHRRLLNDFVAAARHNDMQKLQSLLHDDVVGWSDGGGRVRAARRPIRSAAKVARYFAGIYSRPPALRAVGREVNGAPALLVTYSGSRHLLALDIDAELITGTFLVANPEKLDTVLKAIKELR